MSPPRIPKRQKCQTDAPGYFRSGRIAPVSLHGLKKRFPVLRLAPISGFSVQCSAIRLSDGQTKSLLDETPPPSLTEEGIISPCSSSNESFGFFRGSFLSVRSSGFLKEREKGTSSACFGKIRSSRSLWLTRTVSPGLQIFLRQPVPVHLTDSFISGFILMFLHVSSPSPVSCTARLFCLFL